MNVHHFQHDICGRLYHIEVVSVGTRWRAQLRRLAGMSTALMPFYGATPEEAASQLTRWLILAHSRGAPEPGRPAVGPGREAVAGASPLRYD